jgi:hypothetical protein
MGSSLDDLLKRVAEGRLSPEDALRLIDGEPVTTGTPAAEPGPAAAPSAPIYGSPRGSEPAGTGDNLHEPGSNDPDGSGDPAADRDTRDTPDRDTPDRDTPDRDTRDHQNDRPAPERVRVVRLLAAYRQVTVVADPMVTQVHVTGNHTVRQEGEVLIVEGSWNPFGTQGDGDEGGLRFAFSALPRGLNWGPSGPGSNLTVRINPDVRLEVDATGASLRISGPEAGARLRLLASSLKVDRLRGPLDLDARTSSVKGSLGPSGQSRIGAEQSSVKVTLLRGTSVRLTATNRMGKVILPGRVSKDGGFGETIHDVVGGGEGALVVDASMSSIMIGSEASGGSR